MATSLPWSLGVAVALLSASCTSTNNDVPCPRREPAFHVELTAPGASIPADTTIEVTYQGSEMETFSLRGTGQNEDVCCRLGSLTDGPLPHVSCVRDPVNSADASSPSGADAAPGGAARDAAIVSDAAGAADAADVETRGDGNGADASSTDPPAQRVLLCELLTNGPATVHVTASGYAPLDEELESKLRDDNCGVRTVDVELVLMNSDGGRL